MSLVPAELSQLAARTSHPFIALAPGAHPVPELHRRLLAWDLSIVKQYAVEKGFYTADEIDVVHAEYLKFLALVLAYPDVRMPIAKKVDDFWHCHVLFTQDYTRMSHAMIGRYIHHRPSILDRLEVLEKAFHDNTMQLYRIFFDEPKATIWDSVVCCGQCDGRMDFPPDACRAVHHEGLDMRR